MRIQLALVATMLTVGLSLSANAPGARAHALTEDELFPCDPKPTEPHLCELHGGHFNYATCRCEFP